MRNFGKTIKYLSLVLSVIMLLSSAAFVSVSAYEVSDFDESAYTCTGNGRNDIVGIAMTQLKYHEGNNPGQLSGTSMGSRNYTKYCSYANRWSVYFVVWCAKKANIPSSSGILSTTTASRIGEASNEFNIEKFSIGDRMPTVGDLIFLSDSVGIVYRVDGNKIRFIQGDYSNEVQARTLSSDNPSILYFGNPSYEGTPSENTTGEYIVADSAGAFAYDPSTGKQIFSIPVKTKLFVTGIDGEKYYTVYNNSYCYLRSPDAYCLKYAKKSVSSVTVKTAPDKTEYHVGEPLSSSGLSLNVYYSDGSTDIIKSGFDISGSTAKTGTTDMRVSYGGYQLRVSVNVIPATTSTSAPTTAPSSAPSTKPTSTAKETLKISRTPNKTSYTVGESFSSEGLVLEYRSKDGQVSYISQGYTCSVDLSSVGRKQVTVSYNNLTAKFDVTVTNVSSGVTSIAISSMPKKITYVVGEEIDTSGLNLIVVYSDQTVATVSDGFTVTCDTSSVGDKQAVVSYGGKSTVFNIKVDVSEPVYLQISKLPERLDYYPKQTVDLTGIVLKLKMSDGSVKDLSPDQCNVEYSFEKAGKARVNISYEDCTAYFTVRIAKVLVDSFTVKNAPAKAEYFVNESFNDGGLVFNVVYNNGEKKTLSAQEMKGIKYTYDFSHSGVVPVVAKIDNCECSFKVNVLSISVTKLELVTPANIRVFGVGDELVTDGLVLKATYSNGMERNIYPGDFDAECAMSTLGEQKAKITYGGQTYEYIVLISEDPENANFKAPEEKTVSPASAADDKGNIFSAGSIKFIVLFLIFLLIAGCAAVYIIWRRRNENRELMKLTAVGFDDPSEAPAAIETEKPSVEPEALSPEQDEKTAAKILAAQQKAKQKAELAEAKMLAQQKKAEAKVLAQQKKAEAKMLAHEKKAEAAILAQEKKAAAKAEKEKAKAEAKIKISEAKAAAKAEKAMAKATAKNKIKDAKAQAIALAGMIDEEKKAESEYFNSVIFTDDADSMPAPEYDGYADSFEPLKRGTSPRVSDSETFVNPQVILSEDEFISLYDESAPENMRPGVDEDEMEEDNPIVFLDDSDGIG